MKGLSKNIIGLTAAIVGLGATAAWADSAAAVDGRWDANITVNGVVIPFRLDISGDGATLKGTLYNGDDKEFTTKASFQNGTLLLNQEHYLTRITATLKDGQLTGTVHLHGGGGGEPGPEGNAFQAKRHVEKAAPAADAPNIAGNWIVPFESGKGEKAWRFIVKQSGADVTAAILRVDGDTGALTGTFHDGKWALSHFDGQRPYLLEVTPAKDGSLALVQKGGGPRQGSLTAYREDVAQAKSLPAPSDYTTHTTMKDPNEVFAYSFPDVNGKVLSNNDPKFKGKVVLAIVTGTWCPNCHDEAQYLVQLYTKYHDQGLEIVALDFEEPEQQDDLDRVHAFIKQYDVPYTYLIAGAPAEMWEKVPQAVNLNTWPATLFVGRDGKVKHIHAGFAAPASGEFNTQLKQEFTSTIEKLLAEKSGSFVSSNVSATP
jgi:thiol-disulfide isomerase/thioredoxin